MFFVTVINDCSDPNAMGRQAIRIATLFEQCTIVPLGVGSDLEAAGNLIDALDASLGKPGVILVNVAPRNGDAHQYTNGTPFCYFWYKETLVVSSFSGLTLSLVKKLGIVDAVELIDLEATVRKNCESIEAEWIINTQFRSYEFLPRVAVWITQKKEVVSTTTSLQEYENSDAIWWIDCFGNLKTTMLPDEVDFLSVGSIMLSISSQPITCCPEGLKSVPDGKIGLVIGSSGIGSSRWLEVVINGGSAAKYFNLSGAQLIEIPEAAIP